MRSLCSTLKKLFFIILLGNAGCGQACLGFLRCKKSSAVHRFDVKRTAALDQYVINLYVRVAVHDSQLTRGARLLKRLRQCVRTKKKQQ